MNFTTKISFCVFELERRAAAPRAAATAGPRRSRKKNLAIAPPRSGPSSTAAVEGVFLVGRFWGKAPQPWCVTRRGRLLAMVFRVNITILKKMTPPVGCRSPNDSRKLGQDLSEFPPARPPAYDRTAPPDPEPEAEPEALIGTSICFFVFF